jgi:hypothetical protein
LYQGQVNPSLVELVTVFANLTHHQEDEDVFALNDIVIFLAFEI